MCYEQAWLSYDLCKDGNIIDGVDVSGLQEDAVRTSIQKEAAAFLHFYPEYRIRFAIEATKKEEEYEASKKGTDIIVRGGSNKGVLYGLFAAVFHVRRGLEFESIRECPRNPLRMQNHWDNMDGSIERGYSGRSFFFANEKVLVNERTEAYARMCASVGINAVVLNNVNVRGKATLLITEEYLPKIRAISDIFESYGIRIFLSVNFAAPIDIGGLEVSDPLDERVRAFWKAQVDKVYAAVPSFGGFLVKADSEGRPGPFTYGRTHADGANMLAEALKPYGGIVIWRCFVYNCTQDWRDTRTDRARAGYDNFASLDGSFAENVILQIKNGPMDFQVREPVSPLFGGMTATNQMLEVQAAQEYTGQQKHVCYLVPMWKEVLSFRTYMDVRNDTVADIVSGTRSGSEYCGMAAVTNTGDALNWTGHDLAAVNWFGFGRLAWNPDATAEEIALEWTELTFGTDKRVTEAIMHILMQSYSAYENYTSPLGIGWMVNPNHHYGPNVEGYEYDRWGTYHRASCKAIGVDRTTKGTGYVTQYHPENALRYEKPETTPEELLLFFHRLPYEYCLRDGRTLIQYIYDTHFKGVLQVEDMIMTFKNCIGIIDNTRYERILQRLYGQLASAQEWRDRINTYFHRMTDIPDAHGRKIYE